MPEGIRDLEEEARKSLRAVVEELKEIEEKLKAVHGSLPEPSGSEGDEEQEADAATEIRTAIECVLTDSLAPAARNLEAASNYRVGRG